MVAVGGLALALLTPWNRALRALAWATLLGPAAALAVQRVVPPFRIWYALLPFVIALSIGGILSVRVPLDQGPSPARIRTVAGVAVAVAVVMSLISLSTSTLVEDIGDTFDDAEAIVLELDEVLSEGSWVISAASSHLRYYFLAHDIDNTALWRPDAPAVVYVVTRLDQDPYEVLASAAPEFTDRPLIIWRRYPSGAIWRLQLD